MNENEPIVDIKRRLCRSGRIAAEELMKIAEEPIIIQSNDDDDLTADKLTRAAQAKKICIMDAFEILERVDREELAIASLNGHEGPKNNLVETRVRGKSK